MMSAQDARKIVAENIQRLLNRKGITQTQMADELGFKETTVSGWMTAQKYPRIDKPKASAKEARIIEQLDTLQTADIHALPFVEQCEVVDTLIDRIIISGDNVDIRFKF